jgi:hypothetical protein
MAETDDKVTKAANALAEKTGSDVYIFNSEIERPHDQELIDCISDMPKRKNITLILVTEGGSADAAYRMARCLQENYENFTCIVTGYCKSAGTLLAIGANRLVMTDSGELGPLDVQMTKKDELGEAQSGLTVTSAISALHERSFSAFEHFFLAIKRRSGNRITFKMATDIAANLTGALFAPIFQQIDPILVGESYRATSIALFYGMRLDAVSYNLKDGSCLDTLISRYPHHGFVIDRDEARGLFKRVRKPSDLEAHLINLLAEAAIVPYDKNNMQRGFISERKKEGTNEPGEFREGIVSDQAADQSPPASAGEHVHQTI